MLPLTVFPAGANKHVLYRLARDDPRKKPLAGYPPFPFGPPVVEPFEIPAANQSAIQIVLLRNPLFRHFLHKRRAKLSHKHSRVLLSCNNNGSSIYDNHIHMPPPTGDTIIKRDVSSYHTFESMFKRSPPRLHVCLLHMPFCHPSFSPGERRRRPRPWPTLTPGQSPRLHERIGA